MCIIDPRVLVIQQKIDGGEPVLKAIREALGYTRQQFADILLTSATTIYRWENGLAEPKLTIPQVKAFAKELKRLKVDLEDLPDTFSVVKQDG